jgi:hypothetical protein
MGTFTLWEEYTERAFRVLEESGPAVFTIKYEEFVAEPFRNLQELAGFCGLNPEPSSLNRAAACADRARIQEFRSSPELLEFYEKVRDRRWMKDLGY